MGRFLRAAFLAALTAIVVLFGFASLAIAASTLERSPFTQGQWWDPTRSGAGFELFSVGDQGMAIWFTFDENRRPTWYTAQGKIGTEWQLLQHYWDRGYERLGNTLPAGTIRFDFLDDAQADMHFSLNGRSGTWRIEPFMPGTKGNELDHSGSYFDPLHPGWGFTLTEQGDVLGGVLYAYDAQGFPTWVAGFQRNSLGSVAVVSVRGPCPGCPAAATDRLAVGRVEIEMLSETQAQLRTILDVPLTGTLKIDGARLIQLGRPASTRLADRLPATFPSQGAMKAHLDKAMLNMGFQVPATGIPQPAVPERPIRIEGTGTDDCDYVKSAGSYVYTFGSDGDRAMAHLRVAKIGVNGNAVDVLPETVPLGSGFNTPTFAVGMCLGGKSLATVASTVPYSTSGLSGSASGYMKGRTYVEVFGIDDPARPKSRWWGEIDGHMLASFRVGDRLYVVTRHAPTVQGFDYRVGAPRADNLEVLARTPLAQLVPQLRPLGGEGIALATPSRTYLPPQGSRRRADFLTVVVVDLVQAAVVDAISIVGNAETAHVSGNWLYLAGQNQPGTGTGTAARSFVHRIRIDGPTLAMEGTGLVDGVVARNGIQSAPFEKVRVVTGVDGARMSILEPGFNTAEFLRTSGTLPNASRGSPLPSPSLVRFTNDRLYIASNAEIGFVDLSDPFDPKQAGTLATRGALESLHALPDGRLAATGHEVGFFGIPADLHLTLYDARDATLVKEIQRIRVGSSAATTPLADEPYAMTISQRPDTSTSIVFPVRFPVSVPNVQSGLAHFELRDPRSVNSGFVRFPDLLGYEAAPAPGARSLLFPEGIVYVSAGKFWRQDLSGNVTGPF